MNSRPTATTERACELELPAHGKLAPTAHGGKLAAVEKAMRLYGPPDNQPGTPDRLRATFARLTSELAGAKAPNPALAHG